MWTFPADTAPRPYWGPTPRSCSGPLGQGEPLSEDQALRRGWGESAACLLAGARGQSRPWLRRAGLPARSARPQKGGRRSQCLCSFASYPLPEPHSPQLG
eukprot:bmy_16110T0